MPVKFEPIVPKKPDFKSAERQLAGAVKETGRDVEQAFKETTITWERRVLFKRSDRLRGNELSSFVNTVDEIYSLVNNGTRPHVIRPKAARRLIFKGTFKAKTLPGTIRARQGGGSGDTVIAAVVQHPGSEPRNFDRTIKEKYEPLFRRRVQDAMEGAAKASGHAI